MLLEACSIDTEVNIENMMVLSYERNEEELYEGLEKSYLERPEY